MKQYNLLLPLAFLLIIKTTNISAQQIYYQKIGGQVVDESSKTGIAGASILIQNDSLKKGSATNDHGFFMIDQIPIGRYNIHVSHIGFDTKIIKDVLVESGKEKNIKISLTPKLSILEEVTVKGGFSNDAEYEQPSAYEFTVEQSQRFAATFYDPGRMVLAFPGVTSANDQGNNISIRGNAPYTNSWRLEGTDIVNPNHLTNAGTFTDRVSVVGGGVNILSAQLMDDSRLLTGAFPASYGDALGGILDINLRNGNVNKREYTLQAGLLGLDLAAEGPLNSECKSSFLVNYRYSTIGLLEAIGVPVSDESITFQDLSFNVHLDAGKNSTWNIFGIFGTSSESFDAEQDSTIWENDEDRIDTEFGSDMGAVGISNKSVLNENTSIKTTAVLSQINTDRKAYLVDQNYEKQFIQNDIYKEGILSINSTIYHKTKKNNALSGGIIINHHYFDLLSQENNEPETSLTTLVKQNDSYQTVKAFGEYDPFITDRFKATLGLHSLYFNLNEEISIEPRVGLTYLIGSKSKLDFRYGLVSQSHFPQAYFVTREDQNTTSYPNKDLNLTKSHQFNLAYIYDFNDLTTIKLESYYQKHFNVPVSADPSSAFSLINAVDAFIDQELVNEGEGTNKGIELMIDRDFQSGYYFLFSSSIYDANYTTLTGETYHSRYDGDYTFSFTGGKEIYNLRKNKNRIFGVNLRAMWQGGYRYTPVDLDASREEGKTVFVDSEAFSKKLSDFIRADLRIYFKKNKESYTRTLSFDIQNLSGRENDAYVYYDPFKDEIVTKKQLGIIPFISYRVEF